ncbi:hypothetical protein KW798_02815 [Candidatus Parcubacteria bacterium]|nr:hypothetical protein [Candidatus Parcubacteria bacterium]
MRTWILWIIVLVIIVMATFAWFKRDAILGAFASKPAPVEDNTPEPSTPTVKTFASSTMGISFDYPPEFSLNEQYAYTGFPKKPIHGVSVVIPATAATGTNLSSDTYLAVEQLPRATACTGDIYITDNVHAVDVMENGVEYSVASTSGAGAGNRYDEVVYAIKNSNPCTAVRYYIHSTAIGNYPPGTVREFDKTALLGSFDKIRATLLLSQ